MLCSFCWVIILIVLVVSWCVIISSCGVIMLMCMVVRLIWLSCVRYLSMWWNVS